MEKLTHFKVGQIVNTQGLKGEVRVYPFTDEIDRFDELEEFYLGKDLNTTWEVERVRYKGNMIGIDVYTVEGKHVGTLKDVLQYSANDVYVIKGLENQEYMIPAMMKFVPTIDIDERKMIIDPIKGMID